MTLFPNIPIPYRKDLLFLYGLYEPGAKKPFYIGSGSKSRTLHHWRKFKYRKVAGNRLLLAKFCELDAAGAEPQIRVLAIYDDSLSSRIAEENAIEAYGTITEGGCLCNVRRDAAGIIREEVTEQTRRKMGSAKKGKLLKSEHCGNLSKGQVDRYLAPGEREKMSAINTARYVNDSALGERQGASLSDAHKRNPAWTAKATTAMRDAREKTGYANCKTEEARASNSARVKTAWQNTETRNNLLKGARDPERCRKIAESRKLQSIVRKKLGLFREDKLPKNWKDLIDKE